MAPVITHVRLTAASKALRDTGLIYWAKCIIDGRWELDGLGIRRTGKGGAMITFPTRVDGAGVERPYFRPLDAATRKAVEDALAAALRGHLQGERA